MISAKVIAHSTYSDTQCDVITLELEYPRFIHCFDKDTEVLASIGEDNPEFMSFEKAFALKAKVAQVDPNNNNEISFVEPLETIKQYGHHKMVSFDNPNKLSLCVTDKHRMLVYKRTTKNTYITETWTADTFLGDYIRCRIPTSGSFNSYQYYSDEELCLMAWFIADGHLCKNGSAQFHFRKERKIKAIRDLLLSLNIPYTECTYEKDTCIWFKAPSWVTECYSESKEKQFPRKALYMSDATYFKVKQALLESDGNVENHEYNTTSSILMEQIQTLAHMHNDNITPHYYEDFNNKRKGLFKSVFKLNPYIALDRSNDSFSTYNYDGYVYCVSVPTSYILVRRKGIVYVSGNCEVLRHRMLSHNVASSRAIPVDKVIEQLEKDNWYPIWTKNQKGMQGEIVTDQEFVNKLNSVWAEAKETTIDLVETLKDLGIHKQNINRLLEPFQTIKEVVTGTYDPRATEDNPLIGWNHFLVLRDHKDAQPEIQELARKVRDAINSSTPIKLSRGEWHTPYVPYEEARKDWDRAKKVSASCCAQVSYRKNDTSIEKAEAIFDRLINSKPIHASPLEQQCTPLYELSYHMSEDGNLVGWHQYRKDIE